MVLVAALAALAPLLTLVAGSGVPQSLQRLLRSRAQPTARKSDLEALLQQNLANLAGPSESESMAYLLKTLSKFRAFATKNRGKVQTRHQDEEQRLQEAVRKASDTSVQQALQQSMTGNQQSLLETDRIYSSMVNFSESMIKLIQSVSAKGRGCDQMVCGQHASCTETTAGAECICNEGYLGQGMNCRAPPEFMPHRLIEEGTGAHSTRAADVHVSVFEVNKIAIVFRDLVQGSAGQILVGRVREAGMADLSPPEQFTLLSGKAFSPVLTGTANKRLVIAWRDENRMGTCWLRGAVMGASGVRGAEMALTWGKPVNFCTEQSHKMSILGFPQDRVAVLFSDRTQGTKHSPSESFGNSLFLEVGRSGSLNILGRYRFTDYPVCRLEATKVASGAFVLAARAGKATDDLDPSISTHQEAMAMYGEVIGSDLVFDPNPVNIEPQRTQIWARGISLIAPNTVAYAYQDGADMRMKMAVVEINSATHHLRLVQEPVVMRGGFTPYVSMLSVPYTPSDPHTLIYYEGNYSSMVNLCSWSTKERKLGRCEDFSWLMQKLTSVAGVHLGGGKSFMVFTTESGVPYYGVFGLSKK